MDGMFRRNDLQEGPVEQAYRRYEQALATYHQFLLEHPDTMAEFFDVVQELNQAIQEVREYIRHSDYTNMGVFKRRSSRKKQLHAQLLLQAMPELRELEGLFETQLTVNKAVLDGYVATGQIPREVVDQATVESEDETVRIYGPKPMEGVLKL